MVVHSTTWFHRTAACSVVFMKMLECHIKKCSKEAWDYTEATGQTTSAKAILLVARKVAKRIEIGRDAGTRVQC